MSEETEQPTLTGTGQETDQPTDTPQPQELKNIVPPPMAEPSPVQSEGVSLACPSCAKVFTKPTETQAYNSVRGHWRGTKDPDHQGDLTREMMGLPPEEGGSSPPKVTKPKRAPTDLEVPARAWEREGATPLPDKLDYLAEIMSDFGVKNRRAVLRQVSLGDPESLEELMIALNSIGTNKSRIRSIVDTYARWLGRRIPRSVEEQLWEGGSSPQRGSHSYPRPRYGDTTPRGERLGPMSDFEMSELLRQRRERESREESYRQPGTSDADSRVLVLEEKLEAEKVAREKLERELEQERQERFEDRLLSKIGEIEAKLEKKVEGLSGDFRSQIVTGLGDIGKGYLANQREQNKYLARYMGFGGDGQESNPPPERPKLEGTEEITKRIPPEYLEE